LLLVFALATASNGSDDSSTSSGSGDYKLTASQQAQRASSAQEAVTTTTVATRTDAQRFADTLEYAMSNAGIDLTEPLNTAQANDLYADAREMYGYWSADVGSCDDHVAFVTRNGTGRGDSEATYFGLLLGHFVHEFGGQSEHAWIQDCIASIGF
jgi:hypothetical protein